jgi:hypothetical protein
MMYGCHTTHIHVKKKVIMTRIKIRAKKPQPKTRPAPDLTRDFAFRSRN